MSYKFKAEDFHDAINSIGALGSFEHDLGDFFIRNSDKYKEACKHLHEDMLEQKLFVADMDTLRAHDTIHPFKLIHDEILIALQSEKPTMKRMLSITRYQQDEGDEEEMIIVPLVAGQRPSQWQPAGLVLFIRALDDPEKMQIRTQEFPGAIVGQEKQQKLASVILDAVNIIAACSQTGTYKLTEKVPSKLKVERSDIKDAETALKPFTIMSVRSN